MEVVSGDPAGVLSATPYAWAGALRAPRMLDLDLIVITDARGRSALPKGITTGAVKVIDYQDIAGLAAVRNASVLIDVDLHDISKVKLIKDNLPRRVANQCRIIAIDRSSHLSQVQANGLGASDVLKRPLDPRELARRLRHYAAGGEADDDRSAASIASAAIVLDGLFGALTCGARLDLASVEQASDQIMDAVCEVGLGKWLGTVRRYHEGTFQHCLLVTGVLTAFGHKTGMRRTDVLTLTIAGLLHDIGKVRVPIDILDKPGALTEEEFALMKQHPVIGYEFLRAQNVIGPDTLAAVRHHHEYLDGSGYPDGLSAQAIGDLTRITTVSDIYGALMERRAYKAPASPEAALHILTSMAKDGKVEYDLVRALRYCVAA
jgi:putative nucleotidyltransferase with HDIG domain